MSEKLRNEVAELDLSIDENNLLNEWKGQAALMLDYGIRLADAMQAEDEAKARLSVVAAELDVKIRANPEEHGLSKVTEAALANVILGDDDHQDAAAMLNDARYDARILRAALDAVGQRKTALQGMTDLWLRQWYADPASSEQPKALQEVAAGPPSRPPAGRAKRRASTCDPFSDRE